MLQQYMNSDLILLASELRFREIVLFLGIECSIRTAKKGERQRDIPSANLVKFPAQWNA